MKGHNKKYSRISFVGFVDTAAYSGSVDKSPSGSYYFRAIASLTHMQSEHVRRKAIFPADSRK